LPSEKPSSALKRVTFVNSEPALVESGNEDLLSLVSTSKQMNSNHPSTNPFARAPAMGSPAKKRSALAGMSDLAASPSPKRPVLAVSYPQKI
jgi:hypothetical protein